MFQVQISTVKGNICDLEAVSLELALSCHVWEVNVRKLALPIRKMDIDHVVQVSARIVVHIDPNDPFGNVH